MPPEDIGKFVCKAEREYRQRTQYVVGSSSLMREPSRGRRFQTGKHFISISKVFPSPILLLTILKMTQ